VKERSNVSLESVLFPGIGALTFRFWSSAVGFTSCFYVEIKAFELLVEEGTSVLRSVGRSKGSPERCFWASSV
jgi:hypothetical protein